MNPSPDQLLLIGVIVGPFGVRGQLKLRTITDRPDYLGRQVRTVYLGDAYAPYEISSAFQHKSNLTVLTLKGVTTREAAEELRGAEVAILETDAAPLADGEYYLHQLYHLRVETTEGEEIGTVREVLSTGANEVLVVTRPGQSDALIPMIRDVVATLDIPGGRVVIRVIAGLL